MQKNEQNDFKFYNIQAQDNNKKVLYLENKQDIFFYF